MPYETKTTLGDLIDLLLSAEKQLGDCDISVHGYESVDVRVCPHTRTVPIVGGPVQPQHKPTQGTTIMKTIFTTGGVAKICKITPRTVSKWLDYGRLRGYRIPGSQDRRIPREHLIRFLKEHGMPLGGLDTPDDTSDDT